MRGLVFDVQIKHNERKYFNKILETFHTPLYAFIRETCNKSCNAPRTKKKKMSIEEEEQQ